MPFSIHLSLSTSKYPSLWKVAHVVPLQKSGSKFSIDNYRPVPILSASGELFESFLINNMVYFANTYTVHTDFSKAFDKINHAILLGKLSAYGTSSSLLRWFICSLERSQLVKVNNCLSSAHCIPSGVAQGFILGPLSFSVYILRVKKFLKLQPVLKISEYFLVLD